MLDYFLNHYRCPYCDIEWDDVWSSMRGDRCPDCGAEIEPAYSIDAEGDKIESSQKKLC